MTACNVCRSKRDKTRLIVDLYLFHIGTFHVYSIATNRTQHTHVTKARHRSSII